MVTKTGLSSLISNNGGGGGGNINSQIGKVYGIITTENTPTKELFESNNKWNGVGTVFYLPYEKSKYFDNVDLNQCQIALPLDSNFRKYPLVGELIYIIDAPSPISQAVGQSFQKYYINTVNIWNNIQQNSPSGDFLGKTFIEKNDIRNILSFEGDIITQGRKGNGIRFGSTVKSYSNLNEWSNLGEDGDPITIMVNGYITTDTGSLSPNIEEINKENTSLYLTSTQKLPLKPGVSIINPRVNTIKPGNYNSSQLIANSDRIILNAKKDEVLLFAKGNIEISTDNIININAGKIIHLHTEPRAIDSSTTVASRILLGTKPDGTYPTEPVLLGSKTHDFLLDLLNALTSLAGSLSSATVPTSEGAVCVVDCNIAGEQLLADVDILIDKLETITSNKVYTI
jgi:hypothetical protein